MVMRGRGGNRFVFFIVYMIFGLYLVNKPFNFLVIPTQIAPFEKWIFLVAGILTIIGGINYLRTSRMYPHAY